MDVVGAVVSTVALSTADNASWRAAPSTVARACRAVLVEDFTEAAEREPELWAVVSDVSAAAAVAADAAVSSKSAALDSVTAVRRRGLDVVVALVAAAGR